MKINQLLNNEAIGSPVIRAIPNECMIQRRIESRQLIDRCSICGTIVQDMHAQAAVKVGLRKSKPGGRRQSP
jgi:hypothetical protein